MRRNYARDILALDDLERFVEEWISRKTASYIQTERFAGTGDLGRDVVGFKTQLRHDGAWDNFQCKQLLTSLTEPAAILELGKVFFHASRGEYTLPERYTFISPRGVTRNVTSLINKPTFFRQQMQDQWDVHCANKLVLHQVVPLDSAILDCILRFDYTAVEALDAARMIKDPTIIAVLVDWFGHDPGPAPKGTVPNDVQQEEETFISELLEVYRQRSPGKINTVTDVLEHAEFGDHVRRQRLRYFDAAAFKRYYRDNTPPEYLETFSEDIFQGVIDIHTGPHPDALARLDKTMAQAATVQASGVLARYGRVPVKQGFCHHFVNEGKLRWKP